MTCMYKYKNLHTFGKLPAEHGCEIVLYFQELYYARRIGDLAAQAVTCNVC